MGRKDIYKDGKQFSSEYQPPNESKQVKKHKTWLKELIKENREVFEGMVQKGNKDFWKMAMEWAHSKATEKVKVNAKVENEINKEDKETIKKELLDIMKAEFK